jgi:putative ABC transport system ATP-binding protein
MPILKASDLVRTYHMGDQEIRALDGISFEVQAGTFVSVMGPSGSGKSTLLHLLGGLDQASSGSVVLDGSDLAALNDNALTQLRRNKLGFIFQFFNLLPTMTAWENVALPRLLAGEKLAAVRPAAIRLLERVGLSARTGHKPSQLSGGEMQRVAIARALVSDPVLLLADEPTGNLDSKSGGAVFDLLRSIVDEEGKTLIMVTHDQNWAARGDRLLTLQDGKLVGDEPYKKGEPVR